jgi:hypothetical protein
MTEPQQATTGPDARPQSILAEEVRAYLVTVRGGAPFLSSSDGQLLVEWLDQGVPIAAVLSAIERTARRRTGRRVRTRLTLRACKGEVKKLFGTPESTPGGSPHGASASQQLTHAVLSAEVDRIASLEIPDVARPAHQALVASLRALSTSSGPPDEVMDELSAAVRTFHEALWDSTSALQAKFRAQAQASLAPLEAVVSAKVFSDLIDEQVRQSVRQLVPGVEVAPLWEQLNPGASA